MMRLASAAVGGLLIGALGGCDSHPSAPAKPAKETASLEVDSERTKVVKTSKQQPSFAASTFGAPGRVVAIGDLHGDVQATRGVLRLAGAIDASGKWVGGDLVVVQTGDQLDRGDEERQILDLLSGLEKQATAAGGALHVLNGNHETMNAGGDFRYVTAGGFREFKGSDPRQLPASVLGQLPEHAHARAAAFLPGGTYAKLMAKHQVIAVVGDSVFAHGGVLEKHVNYGIDRLNSEVRRWLLGQAPEPRAILTPEAPVWSRLYSEGTPAKAACRELERVLAALRVKRMVVGHTVQKGGVTSGCEGRVWRIDVGMAAHYGGTRVEALEIVGGKVRVLREDKAAYVPKKPPNPSSKARVPRSQESAQ